MSILYADHAATTPMTEISLQALYEASAKIYGNPSSVHGKGREAAEILEKARADIARCLGGNAEGVIFTSGGSEADNQAILTGVALGEKKGRKHMITTLIEHHAILHTMQHFEKKGFEVTYIPVKENGIVDPRLIRNAIRPDTVLVSVMMANNEIGTIQPIEEIGKICRERGVLFHTDAVQAVGHVQINLKALPVDMLSLSAHKFHGPKGTGVLYVSKEVVAESLIHGGGQEEERRAGTQNIPGIVSMAAALKEACEHLEDNQVYVKKLQKIIMDGLLAIPGTRLNGDREQRLAGNIHVSFKDVESEMLLLLLDEEGIAASSGSACNAGSVEPSHVVKALNLPEKWQYGSLRLSICESNTLEEAEFLVEAVESALAAYRGGASRLELCSNLIIGGTSPDVHLFQLIREQIDIPVHALIRPRFGDFLYTDSEYELMRRQIDTLAKAGVNGIVIGSLHADGSLNEKQMRGLIDAAAGCRITLHRAFDVCKDPFETLEIARQLGVSLILTSGQEKNCWEGRVVLKKLTEKAGSDLTIMVGAGVKRNILEELCREIKTTDYHMSAKETLDSGMNYRNDKVYMGLPGISEFEIWRTNEEEVRESVAILKRMEKSGEQE